jgi:glycine/serine hydroxymethyltransferase
METINSNGLIYGITLNKKVKALLNGYGIRLGTQEIARYGWDESAIKNIASIMDEIKKSNPDSKRINYLKNTLPPKNIKYTFSDELIDAFKSILHKC